MGKFKLTRPSEADLEAVLDYTLKTWSRTQAERYLSDLESCLQELADNPRLGRSCGNVRSGLTRMEHGRHVIFYRAKEYGIRVIRILHQAMLPEPHLLGEDE